MFERGTLERAYRNILSERLKHEKKVQTPFALATYMIKQGAIPHPPFTKKEQAELEAVNKGITRPRGKDKNYDVWDNPKFTMTFSNADVQILYLTREEIERQHSKGEISDQDYDKYWKNTKAQHLEEIAVFLSPSDYDKIKAWEKTWKHEGKDDYQLHAFAIRCGGANQSRDPLNLFVLRS